MTMLPLLPPHYSLHYVPAGASPPQDLIPVMMFPLLDPPNIENTDNIDNDDKKSAENENGVFPLPPSLLPAYLDLPPGQLLPLSPGMEVPANKR